MCHLCALLDHADGVQPELGFCAHRHSLHNGCSGQSAIEAQGCPVLCLHSGRLYYRRNDLEQAGRLSTMHPHPQRANIAQDLQLPVSSDLYQVWHIREASVAITVGNLICTWRLLQKLFKLRSFDDKKAEIEVNPEMGANVTGQQVSRRTIGGTPRVGGPPGKKKSKWGAMSPALRLVRGDLSAFSTFGRSRVEKTVNNESEMTNDTAVGTPGVEEKRGFFARADSRAYVALLVPFSLSLAYYFAF